MSLATHSKSHNHNLSVKFDRNGRSPNGPAILGVGRRTTLRATALIKRAAQTFAEVRDHRAKIEAELYRNRYKHASKIDDDLPIVGSAPAERPAPFALPRVALRRAAGAVVTIAKHVYPILLIFAVFATAVAATILIRLAIWLPLYLH